MSDPYGAAERFLVAYVGSGEAAMDCRPADDSKLADHFLEVIADGPEAAVVALLHVLDVAIDFVVHATGADRTAVARRIVAISESRRAPT
jgi:transcriptional regulator of acetoin/glycerol metabolism